MCLACNGILLIPLLLLKILNQCFAAIHLHLDNINLFTLKTKKNLSCHHKGKYQRREGRRMNRHTKNHETFPMKNFIIVTGENETNAPWLSMIKDHYLMVSYNIKEWLKFLHEIQNGCFIWDRPKEN